jgi:hypothetical protein
MRDPVVTDDDRHIAAALGMPAGAKLGRALIHGSIAGPDLADMTIECLGVELPLAPVQVPSPWPVVVDGQWHTPDRVLQVWHRVVRRRGSPLFLTATWSPKSRSQTLAGMEGQSAARIRTFLAAARVLLLHEDHGGRPQGSHSIRRRPVLDAIRAQPDMVDDEIVALAKRLGAWEPDGGDYHLRNKRIARLRKQAQG